MTAKWRLLIKSKETSVPPAMRIVKCVTVLHNIVIDLEGTCDTSSLDVVPIPATKLARCRANNSPGNMAKTIRDSFGDYFNGDGAIPWQNIM
ncbi:hypothetical protein FKM82_017584 [Ascaphus truei]